METHHRCVSTKMIMNVLYFLVPLAILLAGIGVGAFWWAVRTGQFDDTETPAIRMLLKDGPKNME